MVQGRQGLKVVGAEGERDEKQKDQKVKETGLTFRRMAAKTKSGLPRGALGRPLLPFGTLLLFGAFLHLSRPRIVDGNRLFFP
jgi:hypothetical protein